MEMIINTKTKEVVSADDFQMFSDWRKIKFISLFNCEEISTDKGFKILGEYEDGKKFESKELESILMANALNVKNVKA